MMAIISSLSYCIVSSRVCRVISVQANICASAFDRSKIFDLIVNQPKLCRPVTISTGEVKPVVIFLNWIKSLQQFR